MNFDITYIHKGKEVTEVVYGTLKDLEETLKRLRKSRKEVIKLIPWRE